MKKSQNKAIRQGIENQKEKLVLKDTFLHVFE